MDSEAFYQRMQEIAVREPAERQRLMSQFHTVILEEYCAAVGAITAEQAGRRLPEGRTLGEVVGHIGAWDRYLILAAGEMLAGVVWPSIMTLEGYVEAEGERRRFASVDEFNACQADLHSNWRWSNLQSMTLQMAETVYALFTQPGLLNVETLERTRPYVWQLPGEVRLPMPAGWYLWGICLEHEGVEHAADLGLDG
jgi:hypothetical protein